MKKLTTMEFINRANETHNHFYDYSNTTYIGSNQKVDIICNSHGAFKQTPNKHLRGAGCKICVGWTYNTNTFIQKAEKIHKNYYNYSLVKYTSSSNKVIINCPKHGQFKQSPTSHLQGKGCYKCGRVKIVENRQYSTGWGYTEWDVAGKQSKEFKAYTFYIIKCWNEEESFYKLGRSFRKLTLRFEGKKYMPYQYEIVVLITGGAREICELENKFKKRKNKDRYKPNIWFPGETECFRNDK